MPKLFKRFILLFSCTVVLVAALFFFRYTLFSPTIKSVLVEQARTSLGIEMTIDGVGGTYLTGLELIGIKTVGGEPLTPLIETKIGRIHIRYSLLYFLAGTDSFLSTIRITLDNGFFNLDLTRNKGQGNGLPLPQELLAIVVRNTSIHIRTDDETIQLNGLTVKVDGYQAKTNSQEASLSIEQAVLPFPGLSPDPHAIGLQLLYSKDAVKVKSLQVDRNTVIQDALLDLHEALQGRIAFTANLLLFDGEFDLQGEIDDSQLTGQMTVKGVELKAFPDFLIKPLIEIGGRANGEVDIALDLNDVINVTGSLNLQVLDGRLHDFAVPQLDLNATAAEGHIHLQGLHANIEETRFALREVEVGLKTLLTGKADSILKEVTGSFSSQSQDIGPFLTAAGLKTLEKEGVPPPVSFRATGSVKNGYCFLDLDTQVGSLGNNSLKLDEVSFSLEGIFPNPIPYQWLASTTGNFLLKAQNIQDLVALAGHTVTLPESVSLPEHTMSMTGRLQTGKLTLAHGALTSNGMTINLHDTIVTLPLPDISLAQTTVRSVVEMQISDLSQLTALLGLKPVQGSLHGRIGLEGPLSSLNGSMHIDGSDIRFSTVRIASLQGSATARDGEIVINKFEAQTDEDHLYGNGSFDIETKQIYDLSLQVSIKEVERYLAGLVPPKHHMLGRLVAGLEANGTWSDSRVKLQMRLTEGSYRDVDLHEVDLRLVHSGRNTLVKKASLNTSQGSMALNGHLLHPGNDQEFVFRINDMDFIRNGAELSLAQPVEMTFTDPESVTIDKLILSGNIGRIEAGGVLQLAGNSDLQIRFAGLTGNGWLSSLVGDRLYFNGADFTCKLDGNLKSPIITLQGSVAELGSRTLPNQFTGMFDLVADQRGIDFRKFLWTGRQEQNIIDFNGRLPLHPIDFRFLSGEAVDLTVRFVLPDLTLVSTMLPPEYIATGSTQGELSLHGSMDLPIVKLQLTAAQVVLPPTIQYLPPGPFDLNCDLLAAPDRYSFSALRLTAPSLSIETTGDWFGPPSLKDIITAPQFPGLTGTLDMKARLAVSDFSWSAKHIEAIRRLDGRLDMAAAMSGPVQKPVLTGTIRIADGEMRTSYEIPPIRNIQLAVTFDADRFDVSRLTGEMGGAPFTVFGSVMDYAGNNPLIDLSLQGEDLLLHRSDDLNIRSDADLAFRGPLNRLTVSGDLVLSDGRFTKKFDFLRTVTESTKPQRSQGLQLFSFKEPPLNQANISVAMQAKKGLLIKNNLAQGFIRPDLLLSGTGELPVIQGTVYLDPMKIKLPSGNLAIESGLVRFLETQPDRPQLDITGAATILGYDITMLITGPADEPVVTLSSTPPLPEDQLLMLVLTGTPPNNGTGRDSVNKSSMNVAVYLGRSVLDNWFTRNGTESDDSILERFELEIGRGITRRGEETIDARFRLAENVFRDGDVLFITGEKDAYDYINSGLKIVFRFK